MKNIRHALLASMSFLLLATPVLAQGKHAEPPLGFVLLLKFGGLLLGLLGFVAILSVVVIAIYFSLTMQKALRQVAPHNRLMKPGMVWLNLIPVFHLVWQFVIATRVPDSLRNEFRERGRDSGSDCGKRLGVAYGILSFLSFMIFTILIFVILVTVPDMEVRPVVGIGFTIGSITGHLAVVVGIFFWFKIIAHRDQLASDDLDDGDDGNGRRKPRSASSEGIQEGDGH